MKRRAFTVFNYFGDPDCIRVFGDLTPDQAKRYALHLFGRFLGLRRIFFSFPNELGSWMPIPMTRLNDGVAIGHANS